MIAAIMLFFAECQQYCVASDAHNCYDFKRITMSHITVVPFGLRDLITLTFKLSALVLADWMLSESSTNSFLHICIHINGNIPPHTHTHTHTHAREIEPAGTRLYNDGVVKLCCYDHT